MESFIGTNRACSRFGRSYNRCSERRGWRNPTGRRTGPPPAVPVPEDGYSSDSMVAFLKDFRSFRAHLSQGYCSITRSSCDRKLNQWLKTTFICNSPGLCKLIPHSNCVGTWTIFFSPSDHPTKGFNLGMC